MLTESVLRYKNKRRAGAKPALLLCFLPSIRGDDLCQGVVRAGISVDEYMVDVCVPIRVTIPTTTIAISIRISAYSTRPWPSSRPKK
jgi:hypothetical protein